jgi:hypothetical protein
MVFICGCRGLWHQIEGNQQVASIPVIAHELWCVCVPIDRSVYLSMLNLISQHHFLICIYTLMHINKQRNYMKSNKEIYIVLKFALVRYTIFLLLAFQQSRLWKGSCISEVLKDVKSRGHSPFCVTSGTAHFAEIDPAFQLNTGI